MGKNASDTPAPLKDRVKGSRTNKSGSAASKKSAQGIKLNASIIAGLTKKAKEYNEKHPKGKVSVTTLKAVMRRGMGAYSSSHRPTITGGAPNTRQAWAYARVNAFLRKKGGQGAKPTYVQDNDLLAHGGQLGKEITCVNCGWHWNTNDSDPSDKYVCHKCGYDNRTYYDSEPIGKMADGGVVPNEVKENPIYKLLLEKSKETYFTKDKVRMPQINKIGEFLDSIGVSTNGTYQNGNLKIGRQQKENPNGHVDTFYLLNINSNNSSYSRNTPSYAKKIIGYIDEFYKKDKMADGGLVLKKIYKKGGGGYTTIINGMEYTINKQYGKGTWVAQSDDGEYYKEAQTLSDLKYYLENIKKDIDGKMADGGELDYTKGALEFFKKELGIKSDVVLVQSKSSFNPIAMSQLMGGVPLTSVKNNKFYVLVDFDHTKNRFIRTLAHELVHVKQMEDERLRFEGDKIIFDDEKMTYDEYQKRYYSDDIPKFEEEAFNLERVLQNKYMQQESNYAHGGLTKTLAVADIHKKYNELPKSYLNAQLYIGMKAEMEHTENPDVAKKIALDHLNESPFYYEYLTKMEKQLEGLDVKKHYEQVKGYAKGGEINPDNKGVKDYFAHGSGNVGGVLVGKRHSEGGIKAVNKSTNQPLEMEGGEVVITRNAVSDNEKREFEGEMLTNKEILSRINESGGGVSFADGGDIPESIHTSGKEYAYGGKMVKDHDIVTSCGCKHTMAEGGKLNTQIFNEMFGHRFKSGGQIYGQGGVVRIIHKEIPTYVAFQELFNGLKVPNLRKEYEGFLKENYKINFTELPQKIRTGLLLGSQKLIDNYINA